MGFEPMPPAIPLQCSTDSTNLAQIYDFSEFSSWLLGC